MSTVYRRMQGIFPRRGGENSKVVCAIFFVHPEQVQQGATSPPPGMLRGGGKTSGSAVPPPLEIPRKGLCPPRPPMHATDSVAHGIII